MQAVNQAIQKKTQQEAAKLGNEWKGKFSLSGIRVLQRDDRQISDASICNLLYSVCGRKWNCRRADLQYLVYRDRSGVPGYAQLWNEKDACHHLLGQWHGVL